MTTTTGRSPRPRELELLTIPIRTLTKENPMPHLGAPELIIIALVILLLFGATRLPKLGKSMGQTISGFKKGLDDDSDDDIVEVQHGDSAEKRVS
jgi:sec-independent protein translocase protein TatA